MITISYRTCIGPLSLSVRRVSSAFSSLRFGRNAPIDIHPEVEEAICSKQPIVALETTIVTHGMPFPTNLETARSLENIVRSTGSVPATIGIIGGRVKIGLKSLELERLADTCRNPSVVKISRRDIAPALSTKMDGGTTCSATLIFAALVGIKVFATGGLGGVHRGGELSMDVSADLHDLTRCSVGLVSAGVKSILDIGRTLEYLETLGVPVVSYGRTDDFPAFFTPRSGFKAPWNVNDPQAAAQILFTQWQLGMINGVLFGVPIPPEHESVCEIMQHAVERAITESEESGISRRGNEVTPWLLRRVEELTEGKSLASNIALIQNTALVGGQIAAQYAKLDMMTSEELNHRLYLTKGNASFGDVEVAPGRQQTNSSPSAQLIVIGSTAVDISAKADSNMCTNNPMYLQSTSPGAIAISSGGVGRNIAEAAHRLLACRGLPFATLLLSSVGDDPFGRLLVEETQRLGMRTDGLMRNTNKTAVCSMVLDSTGSLLGGVADMDIIKLLDGHTVLQQVEKHKPNIIALDGNLSQETLQSIVKYCHERCIDVFFEPTSVIKSTVIFPAVAAALDVRSDRTPISFSSPNLLELVQMYQAARSDDLDLTAHARWWSVMNEFSLGSEFRAKLEQLAKRNADDEDSSKGKLSFLVDEGVAQMAVSLLPFFQHLVIKCGEHGVIVAMHISGQDVETSGWVHEATNPSGRCVVAPGITSNGVIVLQHFPALKAETIVNVTGSGDTLVGSLLAGLVQNPAVLQHPKTLISVVNASQKAAVLTLQSSHAVSPLLSTTPMQLDVPL